MKDRKLGALVPAAGFSSRMGGFKPLLDLGGKALIVRTMESLFRGGAGFVTVVLGFRGDELEAVLRGEFGGPGEGRELRFAWNRDFAGSDMLASIKAGLEFLEGPFFLLPADMPAIRGETLRALAAFAGAEGERRGRDSPERLLVTFPAEEGGRRGHPPLIEAPCIPLIRDWRGAGGLRGFWETLGRGIALFPAADAGCFMDADSPADYLRLQKYWGLTNTGA
jgi:CTP:molybdopterin cytidylyltransferase MocA